MKIRGYEITLRRPWPTKAGTPRRAEKKRAVAASLAASPRPQITPSSAKYFEGLFTALSAKSPQDLVGFYSIAASHLIRGGKIEQALKIIEAKIYPPAKKARPMLEAIVALAEIGTEESIERALGLIETKAPPNIRAQAMLQLLPTLRENLYSRAKTIIKGSIIANRDQAFCLASLAHYQNDETLYSQAKALADRKICVASVRENDLLMVEIGRAHV